MKRVTPRLILLAGWIAFVIYAYPGYLHRDGADMLLDSRVGSFTDWSSPVMTQVWRILGLVISGPPGMLVLQSGLLLLGVYRFAGLVLSPRVAALATIGVLLFPPVLAAMAVITPEAQLAGWLVAGTSLLTRNCRRARIGGLAMVVVACGMRDGAAIAALPLVLVTFAWHDDASPRKRLLVALAAWVAVALLACGLERMLVDSRTQKNEVALALSDIVGTLRYAERLDDSRVSELVTGMTLAPGPGIQERARKVYGKDLFYAATEQRVFEPLETQAQRDAALEARRSISRALPVAYLKHRWQILKRALRITESRAWEPVYTAFVHAFPSDAEALSHFAHHSVAQVTLIAPVAALADSPLFAPYVYLALTLVLLPLAAVRRYTDATMWLASGLVYEIALAFNTVRTDFRDSLWLVVATVLGAITLVARWRASRRA